MSGFEHDFRDFMRQQRAGNRGNARDMLRLLGFISLIASAFFWYPVQWDLVGPQTWRDGAIAIAFGTFLALGPPVFVSFFVPWSPAAQLLNRINFKTVGQAVALGCSLFLLYYAGIVLLSWWHARPVTEATGMVNNQVILGIIATVIAPALLWAPVSSDELEETLKQDQLVRRYELQTQLDIAYLQSMVLEAQRMSVAELGAVASGVGGPELAQRIRWLMTSIDQTIGEIAHTVQKTSGTIAAFPSVRGQQGTVDVLDAIETLLSQIRPAALPDAPVAEAEVIEGQYGAAVRPAPVPQPASARYGTAAEQALRDRPNLRPELRSPAPGETSRSSAQPQAAPGSPRASGSEGNWREAYVTAVGQLQGAWKRADLEQALSIRETQAGDYIRAWEQAGLLERLTEPKWHYRWTREAADGNRD